VYSLIDVELKQVEDREKESLQNLKVEIYNHQQGGSIDHEPRTSQGVGVSQEIGVASRSVSNNKMKRALRRILSLACGGGSTPSKLKNEELKEMRQSSVSCGLQ